MTLPSSSSSAAPRPDGSADATRRRLLYAGVAAAAAASGAGWAWWKFRPHGVEQGAAEALWGQSFQTPEGAAMDMHSFQGRPLLLNFWATWCAPCVTEMPLLDAFWRSQRTSGWQVVGLAVDAADPVRAFIRAHAIEFPIGLAGAAGLRLAGELGNSAGGLPFSVALSSHGGVLRHKLGLLDSQTLDDWKASVH